MSEYLSETDWSHLFSYNLTPDAIWTAFCRRLDEAVDLFVPSVETSKRKSRRVRQYPRHIRRLMSRRLAVWRSYKTNRTDEVLKSRYRKLTDDCRDAIRRHEIYLENQVIGNNNVGAFYRHVNRKMSHKSSVGALTRPDGEMALSDLEKAEVLNNYFSTVCTHDDGKNPQFASRISAGDDGISTVMFDEARLLSAVRRIKTKCQTSCGPDGYPIMLLKNTMHVLARPLSQMYSSFISVGKMPTAWKTAHVTPIYKKGPSSDPANYRPISQTSVYCKLMERIIVADVTAYMRQKGFISKQQHGFLSNRSTNTNLLESLSDWTLAVDNKQTQSIVYIDFSRAFDTVSRPKLLSKLCGYGVKGELLSLINDFLTDRQQKTRVGTSLSGNVNLTSGIVQGSCMGPLLFILFINDLADVFDAAVTPKLYADDVKLYASLETNIDCRRLQQNLDRLVIWANTWQLTISIKKCNVLHIGKNRLMNSAVEFFHINNDVLPNVETVVDLGVTIDADLKFSEHINKMVHKAQTRSKLLIKCFVSRDTTTLVRAFKVYVRPILEYCSSVWCPYLIKDVEVIESVQRRFTKHLRGLWNIPYEERLKKVNLDRLDVRRLRLDLILTYKVLFGLTSLNSDQFFQYAPTAITTRGHDYKLYMPNVYTNSRKNFFSSRVLQAWNNLPNSIINFTSLKLFKTSLLNVDLTKYCISIN